MRYTADDEEPNCMMCERVCYNPRSLKEKNGGLVETDWCSEHCGPEHGWNGYYREDEL